MIDDQERNGKKEIMEEFTVIGKRISKVDAVDKATGRALYIQHFQTTRNAVWKDSLQQIPTRSYHKG